MLRRARKYVLHPVRSVTVRYLRVRREKYAAEAIRLWCSAEDGTWSNGYWDMGEVLGWAEEIVLWDGSGGLPAQISERLRQGPDAT